jgi:hypothetical protein
MKEYKARGKLKINNFTHLEVATLVAIAGFDVFAFVHIMAQIFSLRGITIDPGFTIAVAGIHLAQFLNIKLLKRS